MKIRLSNRTFELGSYYMIGRRKCRCVLASPKGVNFLNETTNRMVFRRGFYAKKWSGKDVSIPTNVKVMTVTSVSHLIDDIIKIKI